MVTVYVAINVCDALARAENAPARNAVDLLPPLAAVAAAAVPNCGQCAGMWNAPYGSRLACSASARCVAWHVQHSSE